MKWCHRFFNAYAEERGVGHRRMANPDERRRKMASSRNRYRGVIIVWMAFILIVIILVLGFSLDGARIYMDAHQLQNAVDAAALAGAQDVKAGYLSINSPIPNSNYTSTYPDVVYEMAQEFAKEHMATLATVNLFVPNMTSYDYDPTSDVIIGYYHQQTRQFTPHDASNTSNSYATRAPNAVKVIGQQTMSSTVNNPVPLIFGQIVNVDSANVVRSAIALSRGSTGAGLITLVTDPNNWNHNPTHGQSQSIPGLRLGGTGNIVVNNGDVHDNAQWPAGATQSNDFACYSNNPLLLYCEELNINGANNPDPAWNTVNYNISTDAGILPDPLRHVPALWDSRLPIPPPSSPGIVPLPAYGMAVQVDAAGNPVLNGNQYIDRGYVASNAQPITGSVIAQYGQVVNGIPTITLTPGYYPGGLRLTTGNKAKLLPGVYAFGGGLRQSDGSGLYSGGGDIEAIGCMLHVTASNVTDNQGNPIWGHIDLNGGNIIIREAYDPQNPTADPYGPNYPYSADFKYIAVYQDRANRNDVHINGNSNFDLLGTLYFPTAHGFLAGGAFDAGTQFIIGSLDIAGSGDITINYDGRFWTAGYRAVLVE